MQHISVRELTQNRDKADGCPPALNRDAPGPSANSLDEFKKMLRDETDMRLSVVGPWAAEIVGLENRFRLQASRKKLLQTLFIEVLPACNGSHAAAVSVLLCPLPLMSSRRFAARAARRWWSRSQGQQWPTQPRTCTRVTIAAIDVRSSRWHPEFATCPHRHLRWSTSSCRHTVEIMTG